MQQLGERIAAARRQAFVGRERELALFRAAVAGEPGAVPVLFVHAPAGTGKSALLAEFARIAAATGAAVAQIDGGGVAPEPGSFESALREALGAPLAGAPLESAAGAAVILVDQYEELTGLDHWLRTSFIPRLPAGSVLVVAGRDAPGFGWRSDPGLAAVYRAVPLRNLDPAAARAYLERRDVPECHVAPILAATHGHPLALALFADLVLQSGEAPVSLEDHPDVVAALVDRLVTSVPGDRHREALHVAALARVTTEDLLRSVLGGDDATALFDWLRGLSFMSWSVHGIYPHDLARDVLEADFRWRNPEGYRVVRRAIKGHIRSRLSTTDGNQQQLVAYDKLYLHKRSPLMRPYFDFGALYGLQVEPLQPQDRQDALGILEGHEGEASASIAEYWLERQPQAFRVWRSAGGRLEGTMANLVIDRVEAEELERDPALASIWTFVTRHGGLKAGESIAIHRFWAGREGYQDARSQTVIAAAASTLWVTYPGLAWAFPCTAEAAHWEPMFAYCNFERRPDLDFRVGTRIYGVFAHDWRQEPVLEWLEALTERDLQATVLTPPPPGRQFQGPLLLSDVEFAEAARHALRNYTRPAELARSPLVRTRLAAGAEDAGERVARVRRAIADEVRALEAHPRDARLARALTHTYLKPAATQEAAAEVLGLPLSTFRSHLRAGIDRLVLRLWEREIDGPI